MKASNTRRPLHQQQAPEQKGPFFNHAHDDAVVICFQIIF